MDTNLLAVDISTAPKGVQDELKALSGNIHSMDDLNNISSETKVWILKNADPKMLANKMIESMIEFHIHMIVAIQGITMLETIMPKKIADDLNLKMYNACAEFIREYNRVHIKSES